MYPYPSRRMSVWLNGVSLKSAVPSAIIRNVYENDPENELMTAERPGAPGLRVLSQKRTQLTVRAEIVIREIHDLAARRRALSAFCAWAQPGRLELSNHPGEYLQVIVNKRPALGTDRDYTQTFVVELAAIACPYWQALIPVTAAASGTSGTVSMAPSGTVERLPLSFTVTAQAALTQFTALVNGDAIALTGLTMAAGDVLRLYYDAEMLQWITVGSASALSARTASSADDLWLYPGKANEIAWSADAECDVTFEARGLYL